MVKKFRNSRKKLEKHTKMRYNLVLTDIYMQILQNTKQNKNVFMFDLDETLTFTWIIRNNNKKSKIQTNTMLDRKLQKEHFKQGVLEKQLHRTKKQIKS